MLIEVCSECRIVVYNPVQSRWACMEKAAHIPEACSVSASYQEGLYRTIREKGKAVYRGLAGPAKRFLEGNEEVL